MKRTTYSMQGFLWELKQRSARITRLGRLTALEFSPLVDNQFTVTARWATGQYAKLFTFNTVFRYTGTGTPVPKDRPCVIATRFIEEIKRQQRRA